MDRDEVLNNLTSLDFMAVDLGLYLNTHPTDAEAIAAYNQVIEAAERVRAHYEENFGPLCSFRSFATNTSNWQWKDDPWPWQASFNNSLSGKECL
ncbi:MAG: spore coat protein CotJB [Epulopiscium sp.]|jgi:spore coat protein JB|nr:spore coat protein CotJB [Candidatus Epulonipiscium sp.]